MNPQWLTDDQLLDLHKRAGELTTAQYAIQLERQAEEDRAAIRALRDIARRFAECNAVDEDGNVTPEFNAIHGDWYDALVTHAAPLARAGM